MYHDSLKGPSARRARTRSASSSSSRRLVSVATYRVSAGTRRVPPCRNRNRHANRHAPFAVSLARARPVGPLRAAVPHRRACLAIARSRRVSTASPRFASAPPATDLADSRHDGVPEQKAKSRRRARDAGGEAARGRRGHHPHRLTLQTPGRSVRQHRLRRSRDQGTSPRPSPVLELRARSKARVTRAIHRRTTRSIPAAADRETPRNTEQPSHRQGVYRYVDKKTFLNWGLTSDWLVEGPRAPARVDSAASTSPPTPQKREGRGAAAQRRGSLRLGSAGSAGRGPQRVQRGIRRDDRGIHRAPPGVPQDPRSHPEGGATCGGRRGGGTAKTPRRRGGAPAAAAAAARELPRRRRDGRLRPPRRSSTSARGTARWCFTHGSPRASPRRRASR